MLRTVAVSALLMLIPFSVSAVGFAKQSIFLSRTNVTEGESVLIHAVVSNDAPSTFKGELILRDGTDKIGAVPVNLESGKAIAVSVSWEPKAGKRKVSADLVYPDGEKVETMSETFSIAERPKPKVEDDEDSDSQSAAAIQSSEDIQNKIGSFSPAVETATEPAFTIIDDVRENVAEVLDAQLKTAGSKMGAVQGAQTEREGELPDTVGGFWLALWTVYFYILTVLRFLVGNAGVFYPVFALLFLFALYKTFKRFRR